MKFVFILSEVLQQILLINFLQIVEIVRTLGIHAFMEDEVFPFFFSHKSFPAMRAAKSELFRKAVFFRGEVGAADLTAELPGFAVVAVEIRFRCATGRATAIIWDVAGFPPGDRPDLLAVTMLKVRDQELPVPLMLMELDPGEFIDLKFLIFRGMGIIKCPLLERDISADKI